MTCNQQLSSCSRTSSPPMPCWHTLCTLWLPRYVEICSSTPAEDVLVALHCCSRRQLEKSLIPDWCSQSYMSRKHHSEREHSRTTVAMLYQCGSLTMPHCMFIACGMQTPSSSSSTPPPCIMPVILDCLSCDSCVMKYRGMAGEKLYVFTSHCTAVVSAKSSRHSQSDKPE